MPTSQRNIIKNRLAALLSGQTDAGARVYTNFAKSLEDEHDLPAIVVRSTGERASIVLKAPREYERVLSVEIVCMARATDDTDDKLDALAQQVEDVLFYNETLPDTNGESQAVDVAYTGATMQIDIGRTEIGGIVLNFDVTYITRIDPITADLETVAYQMRADGTDKVLFSEEISMPQT
ncbi:hypothetical protein VF14_18420 [Nostoc linckia z18]|uniref:Uncharacterized protein n=2 Tax=Nostoc linckia TaxID=92942 RepID=A0A9Q5Z976_NOSLI|nr:hypothetical protein [Nostoc linckia]PHJ81960.1 hypothetical protein VF07_29110 [Nostoc linckia z6]PHJ92858.1 hypothetical protein VF04_27825 [Nostoc linckia z7]PHK00819.1 hypothetical protein VF08_23420 [Nostoc linckia z8]PHK09303.1 hypothetical protein VF09_15885 [Nostoc linckia z9]PHK33093.1 hypothetical protein VF14_18420 [Nostoc linckia z18]